MVQFYYSDVAIRTEDIVDGAVTPAKLSLNEAKGLTPTVGTWTTTPGNLENVTDEDLTTYSEGSARGITTDDTAYWQIDLGEIKRVLVIFVKLEHYALGYVSYIKLKVSEDGTTWTTLKSVTQSPDTTKTYEWRFCETARYIRVVHYKATAHGLVAEYIRLFELKALVVED